MIGGDNDGRFDKWSKSLCELPRIKLVFYLPFAHGRSYTFRIRFRLEGLFLRINPHVSVHYIFLSGMGDEEERK